MKIKKVLACLLFSAVALTAGCGSGGGGDSTTTAAPVTTAAANGETAATTAANDVSTASDATDASATAAETPQVNAAAKDFDFVVLKFNCRDFVTKPGDSVLLGDNYTYTKKDETFLTANIGRDATIEAFQQPMTDDPYYESRYIINQNGDFWQCVDHITASFYIEDTSGDAAIEDMTYMQAYIQMGGLSKETSWRFFPDKDRADVEDTDSLNLIKQFPEGEYALDSAHVMTVTWDIKSAMAKYGTLDAASDETEGKGGGVHKFGVQIGDEGIDEKKLKICWTDAEIYVSDKAKFDEYVAKVSAVNGAVMPADAKIIEVG